MARAAACGGTKFAKSISIPRTVNNALPGVRLRAGVWRGPWLWPPAFEQFLFVLREGSLGLEYILVEAYAGCGERLSLEPDDTVAHGEIGLRAERHEPSALEFVCHACDGATIRASDPSTIFLTASSELNSSAGNTRYAAVASGDRRCAERIGSSDRGGMRLSTA